MGWGIVMQYKNVLWRFLSCFCLFLLTNSCGDSPFSPSKTNSSANKSPKYPLNEKYSLVESRIFDSWSTPKNISGDIPFHGTDSRLEGPIANMTHTNNAFISWQELVNTFPYNGSPLSSKSFVLIGNDLDGWIANHPQGSNLSNTATLPQLSVNQKNGETFAIWRDNNTLHVNKFDPMTGWGDIQTLGPVEHAWISDVIEGEVSIIWISMNPATGFVINLVHHSKINGWSPTSSHFVNDTSFVSGMAPVRTYEDKILFAWVEQKPRTSPQIKSIMFQLNIGWGHPLLINDILATHNIYYIEHHLAAVGRTGEAQLVYEIRASSNTDGIFSNTFLDDNISPPVWEKTIVLDGEPNSFLSPFTEQVQLASNDNDQLVALWGKNLTINGQATITLMASRYTINTGWQSPEQVITPLIRYPINSPPELGLFNFIHHTQLSLNQEGNIHIAWIHHSNYVSGKVNQQIVTTHSESPAHWEVPTIITSNTGLEEIIDNLSMSANAEGTVRITWRKEIWDKTSPAMSMASIWTSKKNSSIGLATATVFDTRLSKPINHIDSNNNCLACHLSENIILVDHNAVLGTCIDCHNSRVAIGKPISHLSTSENCDACHLTIHWNPITTFDHTQTSVRNCIDCHNSTISRGKGETHIDSSNRCNDCHSVNQWINPTNIASN